MRISKYFLKNFNLNKITILHYFILLILFIIIILPLILKSEINIYDSRDEKLFHYPTVQNFAKQFPNLDLINYYSATTPLYHIILTFPAILLSSNIILLRFITAIITLFCILILYRYLSKEGDKTKALYFSIIFLLSPYVIGPSIRLSTDNLALTFAILSIYTMDIESSNSKNFLLTNILILCSIFTRQIYAWLILAYLLFNFLKYKLNPKKIKLIQIILPTLIPVLGLTFFIFLWKGMTPPLFLTGHSSQNLNWDAPLYIVSLIGLYGIFFFIWLKQLYKKEQGQFFSFALLTLFAVSYLLLHPVSNEYPIINDSIRDRGGSLWLITTYLPNFLSSSILFWVLFPIGLFFLYIITNYLILKKEYLMIICFPLWLISNIANMRTYQKYYEPFIMFFLGYVIVTIKTEKSKYPWTFPLILLIGLISVTVMRFYL